MIKSWVCIEKYFSELAQEHDKFLSMLELVQKINESEYVSGLYAWTSIYDLCVVQTKVSYPNYEPYLRISPIFDGSIEFSYIDTHNKEKQWSRTTSGSDAFQWLISFVNQLHWFVKYT